MLQITASVYDGGDGNQTELTLIVAAGNRVTSFAYDFRNRRTSLTGEESLYFAYQYDNLDRQTYTTQHDTSAAGDIIGQTQSLYDDRGRTYQSISYAALPGSGLTGASLVSNTWFDAAGNTIKQLPAGSQAFTKTTIDGVGRQTATYMGYYNGSGSEPYADVGVVTTSNVIFEQRELTFDEASNAIQTTSRSRYHNATGGGPLTYPGGDQPQARVSYQAVWPDGVGRTASAADYGTNGDVAFTRPAVAPASSATVLVSTIMYNDRGEAYESTDPAGTVAYAVFDDAGRRTQAIANYVPGGTDADQNLTTNTAYNPEGNVASRTVVNVVTGDQTTNYGYGVTTPNSEINSNSLLASITYADGGVVALQYNSQGQASQKTDQNGTIHSYGYDLLGRPIEDHVAPAAGVDGSVLRIGTTYEVRGMVQNVTSYSDIALDEVVNQVQNVYNGFRQPITQYQEHGAAVDPATSPSVQYSFADGSANTIRPTGIVYPNGRTLNFIYNSGDDDALSRVSSIGDSSYSPLAAYTYLGAGMIVVADYQQPGVQFTLISNPGGGLSWNAFTLDQWNTFTLDQWQTFGIDVSPYGGLDQFDRIIKCLWQTDAETPVAVEQVNYGYDLASNRLWRQNPVAQANNQNRDELYAYDGLYQLLDLSRGQLNDDETAINDGTLNFAQVWELDPTGNWTAYKQDDTGSGFTFDEARAANTVNEITEIETTAPDWVTPAYDDNGNMTTMPQPAAPSSSYTAVYDAWNRMVGLSASGILVARYGYDGLSRRTTKTVGSTTRDYYYSDGWQILEEWLAGAVERQFVWGLRYVDDLVCRDRDPDGSGSLSERIYPLQDANCNVTALIDSAGTVLERYMYSAYGVLTVLNPDFSVKGGSPSYDWETLYASYRWDSESGLYLARYRYLHAPLGVWISRDPIGRRGDPQNPYRYVQNNPVNATDPSGLISFSLDEGNCTVTLNASVLLVFVDRPTASHHPPPGWASTPWTSERMASFARAYEYQVEAAFNPGLTALRAYPTARTYTSWFRTVCCSCFTEGYKLNVNVSVNYDVWFSSWRSFDFTASVLSNPTAAGMVSSALLGGPTTWLDEADVLLTPKTARGFSEEQVPASHEFGHLLGLPHPGVGAAAYTADAPSLMGMGSELRANYFNQWVAYLNGAIPRCSPFVVR